jgi:HK97 gp10 family phage protein
MGRVGVTISGQSAVLENIYISQQTLTRKIDAAIQGAGIACQKYAKQSCPVDTGRLRNSILYNPGTLSCYVNTNVVYAPYVEFGTRHMGAQPFLYPAYSAAMQELMDELRNV